MEDIGTSFRELISLIGKRVCVKIIQGSVWEMGITN